MVKRSERGWAGHFILADRCLFRRNTLIEYDDTKIVVSTVGNLVEYENGVLCKRKFVEVGHNRFYETMAFHSDTQDDLYHDADVSREVSFDSNWRIEKTSESSDNDANQMHEDVVNEITERLLKGESL